MNETLLEEERLERPFDPDKRCSISIWTTEGVKKKLRERGAKVGKSLSGYIKELVESVANGFASEPGAQMYEAELERQAVENNALRTENAELKEKIDAKNSLILQLNSERRKAPKIGADKPESGADMLLERTDDATDRERELQAEVETLKVIAKEWVDQHDADLKEISALRKRCQELEAEQMLSTFDAENSSESGFIERLFFSCFLAGAIDNAACNYYVALIKALGLVERFKKWKDERT